MKRSPGGHRLDGFGVAVPARKAVTSRIPKRALKLVLAVLAGSGVVVFAVTALIPGESVNTSSSPRPPSPSELMEAQRPTTSVARGNLRSYALALDELDGLPAQLSPGTELEIWVAWEPPVTRTAHIQLLVKHATFERMVANLVPGEAPTILLLVSPKDVPALLYGDRWGALSVVALPD